MRGRRSEARRYAVLAIYQWQVSGETPAVIARHFFDDPAWIDAVADGLAEEQTVERAADAAPRVYDMKLFDQLLRGIPERVDDIDDALKAAVDRSLRSIDPVELAILRVGVYELLYSPELPVRVILNEAIDLAKTFGAEQGHRYVNGVLDRVAKRVRAAELASADQPGPR
jgi:N utilization substance protein B